MNQMCKLINYNRIEVELNDHLSVKLFGFSDHVPNQRAMESIYDKGIWIIRLSVVTELSPLHQTEYNAVLLPDQRVSNPVKSVALGLIYPELRVQPESQRHSKIIKYKQNCTKLCL